MNSVLQSKQESPFEAIKHIDEQSNEYWLARELMPLLGYRRWDDFQPVLERARLSLQNQGEDSNNHFQEISVKSTVGRPSKNLKLTKFACYIVAQNGDPRKLEIAHAQAYFAVKTYERESLPQNPLQMIAMLATETDNRLRQIEQSQLEVKGNVKSLEHKQDDLENSLQINEYECKQLSNLVKSIVNTSPILEFATVWRTFKDRFNLASYRGLPRKRFVEAKQFLELWLENEKQTNTLPDQEGLFEEVA